ncbi:hypothetical protein ACG3SL_14485 [Sphingomonas sp. CJ20]
MKPLAGLAGFALLATGCSDQPSEPAMLAMLREQAAFPGCDAAMPRFVSRAAGGGWQGSGITVEVSLTKDCAARWTKAMRRSCTHGPNAMQCGNDNSGSSITMHANDKAVVYLWSLT